MPLRLFEAYKEVSEVALLCIMKICNLWHKFTFAFIKERGCTRILH